GAYSPRTPINKAVQIKHLGGTTTELPTSQ
nr:putative 3B; Vpg [tremovirus B1]